MDFRQENDMSVSMKHWLQYKRLFFQEYLYTKEKTENKKIVAIPRHKMMVNSIVHGGNVIQNKWIDLEDIYNLHLEETGY